MSKGSFNRRHRKRIEKRALAEARKLTPAEAREQLAKWAEQGGKLSDLDKARIARRHRPVNVIDGTYRGPIRPNKSPNVIAGAGAMSINSLSERYDATAEEKGADTSDATAPR